jgi:hypothetical protein
LARAEDGRSHRSCMDHVRTKLQQSMTGETRVWAINRPLGSPGICVLVTAAIPVLGDRRNFAARGRWRPFNEWSHAAPTDPAPEQTITWFLKGSLNRDCTKPAAAVILKRRGRTGRSCGVGGGGAAVVRDSGKGPSPTRQWLTTAIVKRCSREFRWDVDGLPRIEPSRTI